MNAHSSRFLPPLRTGWRDAAACGSTDPELFFPLDGGEDAPARIDAAKRICAGCPVRAECLVDVMAWEDPARRWGVVGGTSSEERADLFARHRDDPTPAMGGAAA
ncbi:WhiB family transcriptional regulator [Pseudonocardia bannensis]|uniref:Transcriptional regulator WhiB n=1 Tax=Pseudonocardia bannensis TaxID=630973 RepID=A0A848DKV8_9PSEU|nr:WhiB family transcriptional regulator [Pseudonocardia bannensis]NMH93183.1 WhiB family transcriptional regulator [Pseudonocardia bannensis]